MAYDSIPVVDEASPRILAGPSLVRSRVDGGRLVRLVRRMRVENGTAHAQVEALVIGVRAGYRAYSRLPADGVGRCDPVQRAKLT